MSVYLSLDIDYWGEAGSDRYMLPFVERVLALKKPTLVVRDHHHLLPHINTHPADRLINVDYHDDIVYRPTQSSKEPPEEGTWASYVEWRANAWFQWLHPHTEKRIVEGICDCLSSDVWTPEWGTTTGWKRVTKRRGTSTIPWDDIIAVGIALSPNYWHAACAPPVYDSFGWLRPDPKFSIGYYKRVVRLLMGRNMNGLQLHKPRKLIRTLRRAA